MSTITREQLITQAQENVAQWRDAMQHNVNTEYAAIRLHLAEIALASLEAEPIYQCEFCHHDGNGELQWHWEDVNKYFYDQYDPERRGKRRIIYTAPPAQVSVPDERAAFNAWNNDTDCPLAGRDAKTAAWLAWSRRAAMLQGAAGNYPVIPDGWVMLPAEPTQAMMNAWLSEVANWRGHAAGYRAMIAAAPQQEVK